MAGMPAKHPGLDAALHRHPVRLFVMGGLDTTSCGVLAGQVGRPLWIHVEDVLLASIWPCRGRDVDEGRRSGWRSGRGRGTGNPQVAPTGAAVSTMLVTPLRKRSRRAGCCSRQPRRRGCRPWRRGGRGCRRGPEPRAGRTRPRPGRLAERNGVINGGDLASGHGHVLRRVDAVFGVNDGPRGGEDQSALASSLAGLKKPICGVGSLPRHCGVRAKYASRLGSLAALHLDLFEQPG